MKQEKHNLNISLEVYKVSKTVETHQFSVGKINPSPLVLFLIIPNHSPHLKGGYETFETL